MTISSPSPQRDLTSRSKCIFLLSLVYRLKWIRYLLAMMILILVIFGVSVTEVKHNTRYIKYIQNSDGIATNNDRNNDLDELLVRHEREDANRDYRVDVRVHNAVVQRRINNDKNSDSRQIIGDSDETTKSDDGFLQRVENNRNSVSFHLKYVNEDNGKNDEETIKKNINDYFIQEQVGMDDVRPKHISKVINDNERAITHQQHKEPVIKTNAPRAPNESMSKVVKVSENKEKMSVHIEKVSESREKVSENEGKVSEYKEKVSENRERVSENVDENSTQHGTIDTVEIVATKSTQNIVTSTTPQVTKQKQEVITEKKVRDNTPITTTTAQPTAEETVDQSKAPIRNTQSTPTTGVPPKKCKPIKNVIFLKTHKTGSSTVINIMQRYAHTHGLKVALPNITHFLGWPNTFEEKYVFEHKAGMKYNILCNHARFHRDRMLKLMADKDTKIVTIIRDPLYQFESTAVYLNFYALFRINRKLNLLDAFFNKSKADIYARTKRRNTHNVFLVKNPITYDMGYPTWRENKRLIDAILEKVEKSFNLVMISDYMAESLAMLKEELCWDLKDIVYFTMNKRPDKYRQKMKNREGLRDKVRNWNKIDYTIFDHYNKTFWERVRAGGAAFKRNVEKLKETNAWLKEHCLETGRHYDKSQPWFPILGYKLKNESKDFKFRTLCENMVRSEIDYTNMLKLKQTRLNWTVPTPPPKKKKYKPLYVETRPNDINVVTTKSDETRTSGRKGSSPKTG